MEWQLLLHELYSDEAFGASSNPSTAFAGLNPEVCFVCAEISSFINCIGA